MIGFQLRKFEEHFLANIFLNQDISINISLKQLKFDMPINNTCMQGTVSQIPYLGLGFCFY